MSMTSRRFVLAAVSLLLLVIGVRWLTVLDAPFWIDEGIGVTWARDANLGIDYAFLGLHHARWLDSVIHALFRPLGPEAAWLTRTVNALITLVTAAAVIQIGRAVTRSPWGGLLAGALYALWPYALWYDRQVLGDPVSAAFAALMLAASLRLARGGPRWIMVPVALGLAGAMLAKFQAAVLIPVPVLTALLIAPRRERTPRLRDAALATLGAGLLIFAVLLIADHYLEPYRSILRPAYYNWNWLRTPGVESPPMLERWRIIGGQLWNSVLMLLTIPALIVVLASLLGFLPQTRIDRRALAWLWLAGIGPLIPFLLVTTWLPPRYLALWALPWMALAAVGLLALGRLIPLRGAGAALAAFILALNSFAGITTLNDPTMSRFPDSELHARSASVGMPEVAAALRAAGYRPDNSTLYLTSPIESQIMGIFWPGIMQSWPTDAAPDHEALAGVGGVLLSDRTALFACVMPCPSFDGLGDVERIAAADGVQRDYEVYRLITAAAELDNAIQRLRFGTLDGLDGDIAGLDPLIASTVLVYPPHLGPLIEAAYPDRAVIALGAGWPADPGSDWGRAAAELTGQVVPFSAVYFNPAAGDLNMLGLPMEFGVRTGTGYSGSLLVITLQPFEQALDFDPVERVYGDALRLKSAALTPVTLADGSAGLGVVLHWSVLDAAPAGLSMALHAVDADGNLIAQSDGPPLAGAQPSEAWLPDSSFDDAVLIPLPPDGAGQIAGVRVILYDPVSGARLRLEDGAEFVTIPLLAP